MKILHLSNTPLSRAPYNIASCQNQVGHSAQVLLYKNQTPNGISMGGGTLWSSLTKKDLTARFEAADVIHLHNFGWDQMIFGAHPELREIAQTKKYLIQYHSDRRAKESFENTLQDPAFEGKRAVLAQYHADQYPEANHLVGNPLPLHEATFQMIARSVHSPVVSFAPSNTHIMRGYDYKGADQVIPKLKLLQYDRCIIADIIQGVPYDECMARKKFAVIGIEELVSGSYHLSFLEYMALGCATIANISDSVKNTLAALLGCKAVADLELAYMPSSIKHLVPDILHLRRDYDYAEGLMGRGRDWIVRYWSVEFHVDVFNKVYASL